MKHFAGHIPVLFLVLSLIVPFSFLYGQPTLHDPSFNREEKEEFKEERERWMEQMHRADPGVNVNVLNEETRRSKIALKEQKGGGVLADDSWVQVAGTLGGHWSERGSNNQAGRTRSVDVDYQNGKMYVAADGGQIWRGTLEGKEWKSLNDSRRFSNVRMLRVLRLPNLFRIIVIYGPNVVYSDDDGGTWNYALGLDDIRNAGGFSTGVLTDGEKHIIYALGQEYSFTEPTGNFAVLYRSEDFGASFTRVRRFNESAQRTDIWSPPGKDWTYLVHGDSLSRVMPDGSMETVTASILLEGGTVQQQNLRGSDSTTLYIATPRSGQTQIHASADAGASWILIGSTTSLFDRNSFAVSKKDPFFIMAGGIETMYSRDAGIGWDTVNKWEEYYGNPQGRLHADIPFIEFLTFPDKSEKIFISTDGGLYRSDDELRTVRNLSTFGLGVSQYYSVYTSRTDTNFIFAGAQDQGFQRADVDSGTILSFDQVISGDYGHITSGDNGQSLWTNYPGFSMYYEDILDEHLGRGDRLDFPTRGQLWLPPIVADPDTPTVAYLAGGGINGGAHLIRLSVVQGTGEIIPTENPYDFSDGAAGINITAFAISPLDSDTWYVITSNTQFFVSTDRGETWKETEGFSGPGGHYFYGASIVPSATTPGLLYVAGAGYSNPPVWVSHDNGKTFQEMSRGLPPLLVFDLAASADDKMVFAATAVGPYLYLADSGTWYDIAGTAAPDQTYWSVDYIDQNKVVRFGTYGRGIWDFRLADIPSDVEQERAYTAASVHLTSQQQDNATTIFTLELPTEGEVSLRIYDLSGRTVAVLHNGKLLSGTHRFVWSGSAGEGGEAPSGEYFCVAAVSGTVAYAKAIVRR